ncbi:hypothetical protein [Actinomyces oris]|uniref:hypothetical protein n=1 Tax=Actinomyces oris TaxID=544580 RepID=UPI00288937D4|nr:hypothetical protein [Actinomyces oris]
MNTAASEVIDDILEQPASGVANAGGALMVAGDTILSITATCAGIRTRMVNDQGWSPEFAETFAQDLARALVNQSLAPSQDWRSSLEGL